MVGVQASFGFLEEVTTSVGTTLTIDIGPNLLTFLLQGLILVGTVLSAYNGWRNTQALAQYHAKIDAQATALADGRTREAT